MKYVERLARLFKVGFVLALLLGAGCTKKTTYVTIGTGGVTGVYYPTGGALAKILNREKQHRLRASAESTGGSVYNINAVMKGDLELGIAQADRQYQATKGLAEWKKTGPQTSLRAICSFHNEIVTLVASAERKIKSIQDLKGMRVNIGNPGSGPRQNAIDILKAAGLDWEKAIKAENLKAAEAPKMLQDGKIDAFFYTVGHPNGAIKEATTGTRPVQFVAVTGMEDLIKTSPFYSKGQIPKKLYPRAKNKGDTPSIGMKATLITSTSVSENVIYAITKTLFENLEDFKKLHPALERLSKKEMLDGLSAPLHAGALKYYKEVGLI